MESPFRSEAAAFRFLLITIGAFALIVVASWIDPWLGFAVWVLLTAGAVGVYLHQRGPRAPQEHVVVQPELHGIRQEVLEKAP